MTYKYTFNERDMKDMHFQGFVAGVGAGITATLMGEAILLLGWLWLHGYLW